LETLRLVEILQNKKRENWDLEKFLRDREKELRFEKLYYSPGAWDLKNYMGGRGAKKVKHRSC